MACQLLSVWRKVIYFKVQQTYFKGHMDAYLISKVFRFHFYFSYIRIGLVKFIYLLRTLTSQIEYFNTLVWFIDKEEEDYGKP